MRPNDLPLGVEGPYKHGTKYRCRLRTGTGRRWLPSADTIEGAVEAARKAAQGPKDPQDRQGGPVFPPAAEPGPTPDASSLSELPGHPYKLEGPREQQGGTGPVAVRVLGPYAHRGAHRCLLVSSQGRQWAPSGRTEKDALRIAHRLVAAEAKLGAIAIRDAIEAHVESKRAAGARPSTLEGTRRALTCYFAGILDGPIRGLTSARAQQQYDLLRQVGGPKAGRPLAIATQQTYLGLAKTFARWAVAKGWLREDPTTKVRAVGKRHRGKPQLRADEGCQLRDTCIEEASEGSTAVLMCMLMALRVSEVVSRVVRDIDLGGTVMRVDDNDDVAFRLKTESSRRPVRIPVLLRPLLARLADGKQPTAPLFPGSVAGRRRRQWLHKETGRLCKKAGVPVICPHSLRGMMATIAVAAGELPEVVAQALGHTSSKMTLKHYIQAGVAQSAQLERGLAALPAPHPALPS